MDELALAIYSPAEARRLRGTNIGKYQLIVRPNATEDMKSKCLILRRNTTVNCYLFLL